MWNSTFEPRLISTIRTNINDFYSRFLTSFGTIKNSLISQCDIRLEINVITASSFLHLSRIIEHIFNGCVRKYLARQCLTKGGRCRLGSVTLSNFVFGVDEGSFSSDWQGLHAWWAYSSTNFTKSKSRIKMLSTSVRFFSRFHQRGS